MKVSYVKTIGFFTSKTIPSVVSGTDRGLYLYTSSSGELSGPWVKSTIDPVGEYYEQVAALLKPGDTYPGVVVSRSIESGGPPYQLVWYSNPKNRGATRISRGQWKSSTPLLVVMSCVSEMWMGTDCWILCVRVRRLAVR